MCGAYEVATIGIKELTGFPVELDQLVGTAIEESTRSALMAHHERRLDALALAHRKAYATTTFDERFTWTDPITGLHNGVGRTQLNHARTAGNESRHASAPCSSSESRECTP